MLIKKKILKQTNTSFDYTDPFRLSDQLTDEVKQIKNLSIDFAKKELLPSIVKQNRYEEFDKSLFKKFGKLGLLGAQITGYGCAGVSSVAYGIIAKEIESVDSAYRSCLSVQSSLVMQPIFDFGNESQKQKWLPALSKGNLIGCFGLTEPDHGSDPSSMQTKARKVKGGYLLSGSKLDFK